MNKIIITLLLCAAFIMACGSSSADGGKTIETPYKIFGRITDPAGNPVSDISINFDFHAPSADYENYQLFEKTDADGNYQFLNLPSWEEVDFDNDIHEVLIKCEDSNYERMLIHSLEMDVNWSEKKEIEFNFILYPINKSTKITGKFLYPDETPVPLDDLRIFNLNREVSYSSTNICQGPGFNPLDTNTMSYNESTGEFELRNLLAGGTYFMNMETSSYYSDNYKIDALPGESTDIGIVRIDKSY